MDRNRRRAIEHNDATSVLDPTVTAALGLLIDPATIQRVVLDRTGFSTVHSSNAAARFVPPRMSHFHIDKANQILEAGGRHRGPDGIRDRKGIRRRSSSKGP